MTLEEAKLILNIDFQAFIFRKDHIQNIFKSYSKEQFKELLDEGIPRRYLSYFIPIIDQTIFFEDIHRSLNLLNNPVKHITNPNKAIQRLARNIILGFYIKA